MPGYEGLYEASTFGRVRSLDRLVPGKGGSERISKGRVLSPGVLKGSGRLQVSLSKDGVVNQMKVHRVVALTFHGPCPDGMETRHWPDPDVTNNRPDNLCYGTKSDNQRDAVAHGTHPMTRKTHCPLDHKLEYPNLREDKLPERECLACSRARSLFKSRSDTNLSELADACYLAIVTGDRSSELLKDRRSSTGYCRRGHLLKEPNLSRSHLKNGAKVCLSCNRASHALPPGDDRKTLSDSIYQGLMRGVAE